MRNPTVPRMPIALAALAALSALLLLAPPVRANDQTWVVGVGLGGHSFSGSDDVRQEDPVLGSEIDSGVMVHYYVEWYALDAIGFGYRAVGIAGGRTRSDAASGDEIEQVVGVGAGLFTINWVVAGAEDYVRYGVLVGYGAALYESEVTFKDGATGNETTVTEDTTGTASLAGAYVDWGGDTFGARAGVDVLGTDLDDLDTGEEVDGSGTMFYVDLRWAFE